MRSQIQPALGGDNGDAAKFLLVLTHKAQFFQRHVNGEIQQAAQVEQHIHPAIGLRARQHGGFKGAKVIYGKGGEQRHIQAVRLLLDGNHGQAPENAGAQTRRSCFQLSACWQKCR